MVLEDFQKLTIPLDLFSSDSWPMRLCVQFLCVCTFLCANLSVCALVCLCALGRVSSAIYFQHLFVNCAGLPCCRRCKMPRKATHLTCECLTECAATAARDKLQAIRRNFGNPLLQVSCKYLLHTCVHGNTIISFMLLAYRVAVA